jgi:hypothetical protein
MAIYQAIGNALVSKAELIEKAVTGQLASFTKAAESEPSAAALDFSHGRATGTNRLMEVVSFSGDIVPFEPIGMNKPLTIMVRHVYTGKYPKGHFLDKEKDMLVTSAIKGLVTYDAAPRAVNFLRKDVEAETNIRTVAATEKGTPLIFYSPALTEPSSVLTLEMIFDKFPQEIFNTLSTALTGASSVPVFAPANFYLLAAGMVMKLYGRAGESIFDGQAAFRQTEELTFHLPGAALPQADFRVVTEDDFREDDLNKYHVGSDGRLVDSDDRTYKGNHPYMVVSLDGHRTDNFKDFTPTAASAALLDRFFHIREGKEQPLDMLMDAFKLYNDWKFRGKADNIAKELADIDPESAEYKAKKSAYDAMVKNILNDLLKPKDS